MNDADLQHGLRDYYESITPADSVRAATLVAAAIKAKRERETGSSMMWRRMAAIAVAGAAVASLVFVPLLLRQTAAPSATSSPTAITSASLPAATASPSASASISLVGAWKVLAASDTAGASWSPDGKWLAVWDGVTNGSPAQQHLQLLDGMGNLVRPLDGDSFVWLDATHYVLSRAGSSSLGSVDSTDLVPVESAFPAFALSNGHGAVALTTIASDPAKTSFVVWTAAGISKAVIGEPEAWSPDGTKLAAWHYTAFPPGQGIGGQPIGWLEVLSWPDLRTVVSAKNASFGSHSMSFDPSGRYVTAESQGISVLDIATGAIIRPKLTGTTPVWDGSGDLVSPADDGSVTTYPISGARATTIAGVGNSAAASTDGSAVLLYFWQDARPITLLRNGASRTIQVPGLVQPYPVLAPDGSGVVVICQVGAEQEALLLVS